MYDWFFPKLKLRNKIGCKTHSKIKQTIKIRIVNENGNAVETQHNIKRRALSTKTTKTLHAFTKR